ncbi:MAG: GerMN domain-containing protein [Desulfuromonadaceae bacterium]|nr:GerMN domain-containing protein [Desulfuromonadaceae bacterium]MDD5107723.1 GerMN domain-containing protein [Desulfuromonadaceae bacterium]
MAPYERKKISVGTVVPFLVCALFFSIMIWQKYNSSHDLPAPPPQQGEEARRSVALFFALDGSRLVRESREIYPCESEAVCVKSVLDEIVNGPVGDFDKTVPDGTMIHSVSVSGNQATIDLNGIFSEAMLSGSAAEMLAVYSLVNTVAVNFPGIQKVKLNIDGNPAAILRHLDLTEPLQPDYSLEQSPAQGAGQAPPGTAPTQEKGVK